jgi:hypothetical protein
MKDENGKELSEKELIKDALGLLSEACVPLFETESIEGQALAFMVDSALKYGQVVYRDKDVLSAAADYNSFEEKLYEETMRKLNERMS